VCSISVAMRSICLKKHNRVHNLSCFLSYDFIRKFTLSLGKFRLALATIYGTGKIRAISFSLFRHDTPCKKQVYWRPVLFPCPSGAGPNKVGLCMYLAGTAAYPYPSVVYEFMTFRIGRYLRLVSVPVVSRVSPRFGLYFCLWLVSATDWVVSLR
jgi:hypothetical protein